MSQEISSDISEALEASAKSNNTLDGFLSGSSKTESPAQEESSESKDAEEIEHLEESEEDLEGQEETAENEEEEESEESAESTEEKNESEKVEEPAEGSVEALQKQVEDLRQQLVETQDQTEDSDKDQSEEEEELLTREEWAEINTQEQAEKPKVSVTEEVEFVTEDQFVDALQSSEAFNTLLNTVFQAGIKANATRLQPAMAQAAEAAMQRQQATKDFFDANPDLKGKEPMVRAVSRELLRTVKKNMTPAEYVNEVATLTRKRLSMKTPEKSSSNGKKKGRRRNPGFTASRGSRGAATRTEVKDNSQTAQIGRMIARK